MVISSGWSMRNLPFLLSHQLAKERQIALFHHGLPGIACINVAYGLDLDVPEFGRPVYVQGERRTQQGEQVFVASMIHQTGLSMDHLLEAAHAMHQRDASEELGHIVACATGFGDRRKHAEVAGGVKLVADAP